MAFLSSKSYSILLSIWVWTGRDYIPCGKGVQLLSIVNMFSVTIMDSTTKVIIKASQILYLTLYFTLMEKSAFSHLYFSCCSSGPVLMFFLMYFCQLIYYKYTEYSYFNFDVYFSTSHLGNIISYNTK